MLGLVRAERPGIQTVIAALGRCMVERMGGMKAAKGNEHESKGSSTRPSGVQTALAVIWTASRSGNSLIPPPPTQKSACFSPGPPYNRREDPRRSWAAGYLGISAQQRDE